MYSPSNKVVVELLEPSLRVSRGPALQRGQLQRVGAEAHPRLRAAGGISRRHVRAVGLAGEAVRRRRVGGRPPSRAAARRARLLIVLLQARSQL